MSDQTCFRAADKSRSESQAIDSHRRDSKVKRKISEMKGYGGAALRAIFETLLSPASFCDSPITYQTNTGIFLFLIELSFAEDKFVIFQFHSRHVVSASFILERV